MIFRRFGRRAAILAAGAALGLGVALPAHATSPVPNTNPGAATAPSLTGGNAVSPAVTVPAVTRSEVMRRAASWVGLGLIYDSGPYQGYRTDCSGYASMAWKLATPGMVTGDFAPGKGVTVSIAKGDLKAGDALNNPGVGPDGHVALFDQWTDSSHTHYWGYEFSKSGVHHRVIPYPYFPGFGTFVPVRNKSIVDDIDPGMKNLAAVGDQTGDGVPDIIATEVSSGKLFRYSGPDYAGEAARTQIGTAWNVYDSITAVGDLTGDGVSDIIAYGSDGKLYRYSGPGYGGSTKLQIGVAWDSMANVTAVGDQTGDGIPDVIAVEKSTGKLFRYAGPDFDGSTRVEIGTGWNVYDTLTAVGDQNGDGVTDIIASGGDGNLYRYSGPGYGGSTKVQIGVNWDSMNDLVSPGDLTGDGVPDLIAVELSTGKLFRYSGPGFTGGSRVQIGVGW